SSGSAEKPVTSSTSSSTASPRRIHQPRRGENGSSAKWCWAEIVDPMKPSLVLVALFVAACGSKTEPPTAPVSGTPTSTGSCAPARPDFGAAANAADRAPFTYNAHAPLDLEKAVESTKDGVEVSAISFSSPD